MTYVLKLTSLLFVVSLQAQQVDWVNNIKNKPTIDVRKYGAKGDGIHVDTYNISKAINATPDGWTLFFPAGTYLTDQVNVPQSIKIIGESPESTIFKSITTTSVGPLLVFYANPTGTPQVISNLTLDCRNSMSRTSCRSEE